MLERVSTELHLYGMAKSKRPADPNIKAKLIVDIATGETPDPAKDLKGKNPAAVALRSIRGA